MLARMSSILAVLSCLTVHSESAPVSGCQASGSSQESDIPCFGDVEYTVVQVGFSNAACQGCTILWSWTISDGTSGETVDSGFGVDKSPCGSDGLRHVIPCPGSNTP